MSIAHKAIKAAVEAFGESIATLAKDSQGVSADILASVARLVPVYRMIPAKDKTARGEVRRQAEKVISADQVKRIFSLASQATSRVKYEGIETFEHVMSFLSSEGIQTQDEWFAWNKKNTAEGRDAAVKSANAKDSKAKVAAKEADSEASKQRESDRLNALTPGAFLAHVALGKANGSVSMAAGYLREAIAVLDSESGVAAQKKA